MDPLTFCWRMGKLVGCLLARTFGRLTLAMDTWEAEIPAMLDRYERDYQEAERAN